MTGIPYNYGKYIDDTVRLRDQGTVDAGKQIQSPASAGSRGLAKTTQFTNDRTQMQMGNSPIAESMVEIRNILNRIDGVNAPVQEDDGEQALANDLALFFAKRSKELLQSMERPDKNDQEYEEFVDIAQAFKKGIQAGLDEVNMSDFEFSNNPFGDFGRGIDDGPDEELVDILNQHGYQPGPDGANDKATIVKQKEESAVQEKEFNPNDERDEAPREGDVVNHKDLGKVSVVKVTGSDQMGQPAEYMVQAKLSYDELMGDVELGKFESYQPFPEGDEFDIEEDEDFEEVLRSIRFPRR